MQPDTCICNVGKAGEGGGECLPKTWTYLRYKFLEKHLTSNPKILLFKVTFQNETSLCTEQTVHLTQKKLLALLFSFLN